MTRTFTARARSAMFGLALIGVVTMLAAGCASTPGPIMSPEQHMTVDAGFDDVWTAAIKLLLDQKLVLDTRDYPSVDKPDRIERGRIEALKATGKGFLKRYRQRLAIVIAAGPDGKQTLVAARVIAETYSRGLLTEPAWREQGTPDESLADTFLGELRDAVAGGDSLFGSQNSGDS